MDQDSPLGRRRPPDTWTAAAICGGDGGGNARRGAHLDVVEQGRLGAAGGGEGGQQLLVGAHLLLDGRRDLLRILAAQGDHPDQRDPQDLRRRAALGFRA